MSKYTIDQNVKGEWFLFDDEDCYCIAGPFVSELSASETKSIFEQRDALRSKASRIDQLEKQNAVLIDALEKLPRFDIVDQQRASGAQWGEPVKNDNGHWTPYHYVEAALKAAGREE